MINFCCAFFSPRLSRMLSRTLVVGAVAGVGLLCGLAPDLSRGSTAQMFSSAANAQEINNDEVTNYAAAVLTMEPVRRAAYNRIKQIIGREPPPIVCYRADSLNALTGEARKIASDYCNRSQDIVESHHLSIERFNSITMKLQTDSNLKNRIQTELLRLQR